MATKSKPSHAPKEVKTLTVGAVDKAAPIKVAAGDVVGFGAPPPAQRPAYISQELWDAIADIVDFPLAWWTTAHLHFGGRRPVDLLGTPDEHFIQDWAGAVRHGFMS